ncbi:hypothetical protein LTR53_018491, partial [Teratosphaeriaceae sp. CCFEE 6253]
DSAAMPPASTSTGPLATDSPAEAADTRSASDEALWALGIIPGLGGDLAAMEAMEEINAAEARNLSVGRAEAIARPRASRYRGLWEAGVDVRDSDMDEDGWIKL